MEPMKPRERIKICANESCFIIAEAGVNHNGDINTAKQMIDVAGDAGADAVKFQTFKAESIVSRKAGKAEYQEKTTGQGTQFDMIKKLELSPKDFKILAEYAREKGIVFLSTPFDIHSVDILDELDMPAFKIASGEITNFPLLKHIARIGKPIIMSTGMATMEEIKEAIDLLKANGANDLVILHCITSYPARMDELNLRVMEKLRNTFGLPVGYSDHSVGIMAPVAAVALGACVVEKHFTLDKALAGPDHIASLSPGELKEMVKAIRMIESAMGSGEKIPTADEEKIKLVVRKSIVSGRAIKKGEIITEEMLEIKRPGTGIEPKHWDRVIGRKAAKDIDEEEILTWEIIA